jgi:hypothetical protein
MRDVPMDSKHSRRSLNLSIMPAQVYGRALWIGGHALARHGDTGRKHRSQRALNAILLSAVLIAVVLFAVYSLTRSSGVTLPDYLSQCVPLSGQDPVYVSEPTLQIVISGQAVPIPAHIGVRGSCYLPINTRESQNPIIIHIDSFQQRLYTVGDFFLVWGWTYGAVYATFNQNQLFNLKATNGHNITMTVNGFSSKDYEKTPFSATANVTSNPWSILITYS